MNALAIAPTRRSLLLQIAASMLAVLKANSVLRAEPLERPLAGAIRWDAWYAPGSEPTQAIERSLTPLQFQPRLPFFAQLDAKHRVSLPALTPKLMDLEIAQAAYAGLDFWAFVGYPAGSPMTVALRQYLASSMRRGIRFCMFTQLEYWGTSRAPAPLIDEHIALMKHDAYLRVFDGRPLYFLGFITAAKANERWGGIEGLRAQIARFRESALAAKVGDPYLVLGGYTRETAALAPVLASGDAIGTYAIADPRGTGDYAALAHFAESGWQTMAAGVDKPVVPTVMTGWDRRPRVEHPVPWERQQRPGAGIEFYYGVPQPAELSAHLRRAFAFIQSQPTSCRAPVALIYAWNENDEGGWLVPTVPCDTSRLEALHAALTRSQDSPPPSCALAP